MTDMDLKLKKVCEGFCIRGEYQGYEEIKVGNVNRTYKVNYINPEGQEKAYIVQKVNTYVFKQPVQVMENIDKVTEHIRSKAPNRIALHFHHTMDRKTYIFDENGFWRLFNYIPSTTYNACKDMAVVHNAGTAFGEFQMMLADFDAGQLHETIPDFHNTRKRYQTLIEDAEKDPLGRLSEVRGEYEWLLSVQDQACTLTDMYNRGELPLRVTHNDTKINNVLFEKEGQQAIVVIDLDTVMPGLVGADFGDAIRFAANKVEEGSDDLEHAGIDLRVFREFAEGFLMRTAAHLTQAELDTLALSSFVLTCELATRFLDDYILGDPYFKINTPKHNLVRTQGQVALAKDMLKHMDEMKLIVRECVDKYK